MPIVKKKLQNFFKGISYKIFKILYGSINGKLLHLDNEDINLEKVQIDKIFYKIYCCKKSSLYYYEWLFFIHIVYKKYTSIFKLLKQ